MTEKGLFINPLFLPMYEKIKEGSGVTDVSKAWFERYGADEVHVELPFNTLVRVLLSTTEDKPNAYWIKMKKNMRLASDFFHPKDLFFCCNDSYIETGDFNADKIIQFLIHTRDHLEKIQSNLTRSTYTLIWCLLHVGIPKDVARMFGRFYFETTKMEMIKSLNLLK